MLSKDTHFDGFSVIEYWRPLGGGLLMFGEGDGRYGINGHSILA